MCGFAASLNLGVEFLWRANRAESGTCLVEAASSRAQGQRKMHRPFTVQGTSALQDRTKRGTRTILQYLTGLLDWHCRATRRTMHVAHEDPTNRTVDNTSADHVHPPRLRNSSSRPPGSFSVCSPVSSCHAFVYRTLPCCVTLVWSFCTSCAMTNFTLC